MERKDFMLVVRKADPVVYREFKKKAVERNLSVGRALVKAMQLWIEEEGGEKKPDPRNFMKVVGMIKTERPVKWSTEVDETLYGWKK